MKIVLKKWSFLAKLLCLIMNFFNCLTCHEYRLHILYLYSLRLAQKWEIKWMLVVVVLPRAWSVVKWDLEEQQVKKMKRNDVKSRQSNGNAKEQLSDSSSSTNVSTTTAKQQEAMQKLGTIFKKKSEQKQKPDSWQSLIHNLLNSQRGKLPLLLAVEAGNQSMVRELLSSQTQEQLKVSRNYFCGQISAHLLEFSKLFVAFMPETRNYIRSEQKVCNNCFLYTHVFMLLPTLTENSLNYSKKINKSMLWYLKC